MTVYVPESHASENCPSLATSRGFFAAAVVFVVMGSAVILRQGWILTRLDWISAILASGAFAYSFWLADPVPMTDEGRKRNEMLSQFAVFVVFLAFYAITAGSDTSPFDAHVRQAVALVHGHSYIDAPVFIEHAHFEGHDYQLHPPMPSFLLMPFAAIWGMNTNQTMFSIVLGAICVALAWRLLGKFPIDLNARIWLTPFFGAGTIIWHEATTGGSWELTMVVAVLFTILALDEIFGQARGALVGLWAACAALSRYDLAFVWPIYVLLIWLKRRSIADVTWMMPGFIMAGLVYLTLNLVRYHSLFDRGAFLFEPNQTHFFGVRNIPGNIAILLFSAPAVDGTFPYFHPTIGGQSILLTSPAFILALRPSFRRLTTTLIGIGALVGMTPVMLFFGSGASQFGARHFVQIYPFLLVLLAMGVPRRVDQLTRILIGVSIFFIGFGVWHIRVIGFG
jgi:hypothetical protein